MKRAITLSDDTFDHTSGRAKELGMSRSEFFARAAVNYVDELGAKLLIAQMQRRPAKRRPGNVFLRSAVSGPPRDAVVNATILVMLNGSKLEDKSGQVPSGIREEPDARATDRAISGSYDVSPGHSPAARHDAATGCCLLTSERGLCSRGFAPKHPVPRSAG